MRPRSTVVYLIIVLVLALVYLYEIHREKKTQEAQTSAERLFHVPTESMETITLIQPGRTIQLQKKETPKGSRWWIMAPVDHPADGMAAEELAGALASLRSMRMITENPERLDEYGLQEPELTLHFTAGQESGSLTIGDMLPTEDGYYARTGDDTRVRILSDLDQNKLDKDLNQLMRKRLFTLSLEDVTRFVIARGSESWELFAEKEQWRFQDDPDFPVNTQKVNSILIRFTRADAISFVDKPDASSSFGLEAPRVRITLSDGKTTESLRLGNPMQEGSGMYARMEAWSQVVTVPTALLECLPADREELKEKEEEDSGNP